MTSSPSTVSRVTQVIAIVFTALSGLVYLFAAFSLVIAFVGGDPHGYSRIFGSLLLIFAAVVLSMSLPGVARRDQPEMRRRANRAALILFLVALALAALAIFTG